MEKKKRKQRCKKRRETRKEVGTTFRVAPFSANKICRTGEKKVQITSREKGTKIVEVKTQDTNRE